MIKADYTLRFATQEDADFFYPKRLMSFRAWVLEYKKEVIAIWGYLLSDEGRILFSKTKHESVPKKTFWKVTQYLKEEISKTSLPIWAIRDSELTTSERFLARLGFRFSHIHNNEEVYLWHKL